MPLKIPKKDIIYFLGIQSLFSNYFVSYIRPMYYLNLLVKISFFAYLIMIFIYRIKKRGCDKFVILGMLFNGLLVCSTIINKGSLTKCLGYVIISLAFTLLPMFSISDQKTINRRYLDILTIVFRINIYINLILLLLLPNGFMPGATRINYLGYDNLCVPIILAGFIVMMYHNYLFNKTWIQSIIDFIVCTVSMIILWSGTGLVGYTILCIIIFIQFLFPDIPWYRYAAIITLIAFASIVIFNVVERLAMLVDFLGKDLTFTGRTYIWKAAINTIKKAPLFGQGIHETPALVFNLFTHDYRQAHNEYLQTVLQSGYIGASLFAVQYILGFYKAGKALRNYKNKENIFILAGLVAFLVISITETYTQYFMPSVLLGIAYYYGNIDLRNIVWYKKNSVETEDRR